jgi:hypothetical protein
VICFITLVQLCILYSPFVIKLFITKIRSYVDVHGAQSLIFSAVFCISLCVLLSILAHLVTKGHTSCCHHLPIIACPLSTFSFKQFNLLWSRLAKWFATCKKHLWNVFNKNSPFRPTSSKYLKVLFTLVNFPSNRVANNQCRGLVRMPLLLTNWVERRKKFIRIPPKKKL